MNSQRGIWIFVSLLVFFTILILVLNSEKSEEASVSKGMGWLIKNRGAVSADIAASALEKARKISGLNYWSSEELGLSKTILSENNFKKIDSLDSFSDVLDKIIANKCLGEDYQGDGQKINQVLALKKDLIFSSGTPAQILITLYKLGRLGIFLPDVRGKVLNDLKTRSDFSTTYVYGLTHIIFTESDFYGSYLDPQAFDWEKDRLHEILGIFNNKERLDDTELDVGAEVVISLKLLKEGETGDVAIFKKKLINWQNEDGSWGDMSDAENKFHHTYNAAFALMKFPDQFREGDVFCPTSLIK